MTVAAGVLVLGSALLKDVVAGAPPGFRAPKAALLAISYALLLASIWTGLRFMSYAAGTILCEAPRIGTGEELQRLQELLRRTQRLFLAGLVSFALFAAGALLGWSRRPAAAATAPPSSSPAADPGRTLLPGAGSLAASATEGTVYIHYLEIVTPDVDATCAAYERLHRVRFGAPDAGLGNARTASLPGGGMLGVRAPLHETEAPVVRPYVLVDDIEAAAAAAVEAGGEIAHPPLEIPGHGAFAIYIQGGIHHGLWQL